MTGLDKESLKYLNSTSKSLLIPAGVLLPGYSYQVSVEVVGGELVIAKVRLLIILWGSIYILN